LVAHIFFLEQKKNRKILLENLDVLWFCAMWCAGCWLLVSRTCDIKCTIYTLSVKLSDFTVWRHTWRKNCVNCAVLTGNSAGFRTVFPIVSHTENCTVHWGNPTVSSVYLPTPRWHHLKVFNVPQDEHRMIYSFSNITSYSTFYAFFSSFRITLWPMWLENSKRQPCFYPP
jgi:hypothetical protein